ncbi:MAG: hypothetical protein ACOCUY_03660 [Verrucomicrobiota bacterium]
MLLNRLEIGSWESFVSWYRQTINAMVAGETRMRRQPHWSTAGPSEMPNGSNNTRAVWA